MSIISIADFSAGELKITRNNAVDTDLQSYIDETEEKILRGLLGDTLYIEFIAQLPTPTLQKWTDLLNGYNYTIENEDGDNESVYFIGVKKMLRLFTWFYFVREQSFQNSIVGQVKGASQASANASMAEISRLIKKRYNKAIDLYNECEKFLEENDLQERTSTSVVDNGGGSFTFNISNTRYLVDGATVKIGSAEYTVSNVVADTSFDITGATETYSGAVEITYEIFDLWKFRELDKMGIW